MSCLRCLLSLTALSALLVGACSPPQSSESDTPTQHEPAQDETAEHESSGLRYPELLAYRGAPAEAEDWSFAPFADQGSWLGFALPPEDRQDLHGGFTGPFLMTHGRWVGPQAAALRLVDADSGEPLHPESATDFESTVWPGLLTQSTTLSGLRIEQQLWFEQSGIALIRAQIQNTGTSLRHLTAGWVGTAFKNEDGDQAAPDFHSAGLVLRGLNGASLYLDSLGFEPSLSSSDAMDPMYRYTLGLTGSLDLPAGETVSLTIALSLVIDGDERDAQAIHRLLRNPDESFHRRQNRWHGYVDAVTRNAGPGKPAKAPAVKTLAVKALQTLVSNWRGPAGRLNHSGIFPSSNIWYFNGFWAWDSWKHAVGTLMFDPELAKDQMRLMFDHQNKHGMIPDVIYLDASEDNWRDTKPPLAGWALQAIHRATGDLDVVRELYPKLVDYHRFWYRDRDHDQDGLCEYGSTDGTLEAARWESGMDNAVRFDSTQMLQNGPEAWSMDQESVDLNSYLYREKLALEYLAEAQDLKDEAGQWAQEAERLQSRIQEAFFDEETGWFYDIHVETGERVPAQGPEGWTPLWTGVASEAQAAKVREGMMDPAKFRTYVPLPTVSRAHGEFSEGYWRGLVWIDQVYFGIEGLRKYGYVQDADALRDQLFANLEGALEPGEPLRENYVALTGEGRNANHFSWTAAHLLMLAQTP